LSFTAEEAWAVLNPARAGEAPDSVFLHTWKEVLPKQEGEAALAAKWRRLREIRAEVTRKLEDVRAAGGIGSSLQAEVDLAVGAEDLALLAALGDDLKFLLIISRAAARAGADGIDVSVAASTHAKCERCWHWRADVGAAPKHPTICARCVSNLEGPGEERRHA
ncbi:MAG TPA: zinc finger domain-containing protein, partial [Usitatibacter sp.]